MKNEEIKIVKTVKIFTTNKNKEIFYAEYDYIDFLVWRLKYVKGEIKGKFWVENEWGGFDKIDKFGTVENVIDPFFCVSFLLKEIIQAQCKIRLKK